MNKVSRYFPKLRFAPALVAGLLLLPYSVANCALALAEGHSGEGHAGGGHHLMGPPPPWSEFFSGLLVYWFNFLLYCTVVFLITRKPIGRVFAARRAAIEERVMAGKRALEAAQAELDAAQKRVATLDTDIVKTQNEIAAETESEVRDIAEDARARAARIAKQAEDSIAGERRGVERQVEQELIQSALLLAREKLQRENSDERDRSVREASLKRIQSLLQQ